MESAEQLSLVQCTDQLCNEIAQDPVKVTQKLYSKGFVSEAQVSTSLLDSKDAYSKASALVQVIRRKVVTPDDFETFLNVLSECSWLDNVVKSLREKYESHKLHNKNSEDDLATLAKVNKEKLEMAYTILLGDVIAKLEQMRVDFQLLHSYVSIYINEIQEKASTIAMTLRALAKATKWKCDSIIALEEICKKIGKEDKDLMEMISEYKSKLAGFKVTTKIIHFLKCMKQDQEEEIEDVEPTVTCIKQTMVEHDPRYCHRLSVKLKACVTERSLDYVDELWTSIQEYLYIPALPPLLMKICDGCIEVHWKIPQKLVTEIIAKKGKLTDLAKKHEITLVKLNESVLYPQAKQAEGAVLKSEETKAGMKIEEMKAVIKMEEIKVIPELISKDLCEVEEKWLDIGKCLGITQEKLQTYKSKDDPLLGIFQNLMESGQLSLNAIVVALKSIGETKLAERINQKYTLLSTAKCPSPSCKCYVFVDHSNVWIGGKEACAKNYINAGKEDSRFRIEYTRLIPTVIQNRDIACVFCCGPNLPPTKPDLKFKFDPCPDNTIDSLIYQTMHQLQSKDNVAFIVITGNEAVIPAIEETLSNGIPVELWSWEHTTAHVLKDIPLFSLHYLDKIPLEKIGFIDYWYKSNKRLPIDEEHAIECIVPSGDLPLKDIEDYFKRNHLQIYIRRFNIPYDGKHKLIVIEIPNKDPQKILESSQDFIYKFNKFTRKHCM